MNFKKPGPYLVALFLLLFFLAIWHEEASAETAVSLGQTVISGQSSKGFTLVLEETWRNKYRAALGYVSPQTCRCSEGSVSIKENAYFHLARVVRVGKLELSLGPLYQVEPNRVTSSRMNFKLGLRWNFGGRLSAGITHVSNAGAGGAKIGTGWNTGQDTLPELVLRLTDD